MKKLIFLLLLPFTLLGQIDTSKYNQGVKLLEQGIRLQLEAIELLKMPEPKPALENFFWGVNAGADIDMLLSSGAELPINNRQFHLCEKDSRNRALPRDYEFELLPDANRGVGVEWNGTYLDQWNRYVRIKTRAAGILVSTLEVVFIPNGKKDFPGKHWNFYDYAYVNGLDGWSESEKKQVYDKAYEYFFGYFVANGEIVTHTEFQNETWSLTPEEYKVVLDAFFDAYYAYNKRMGRTSNFLPKLGTNALPVGQGAKYNLCINDMAYRINEFDYISVHVYPIDLGGNWQPDFSIVEKQLETCLQFQRTYAPEMRIWITETGYPEYIESVPTNYSKEYFQTLHEYTKLNPEFQSIWAYTLLYEGDPTGRFGECYMIKDGVKTDAYKWILEQ